MLKKLRLSLAYHSQALTSSINFLYLRPLSSIATVLVIAITLTLPALCWVFSDNLNELALSWKKQSHISLYLKTSLTTDEESAFVQQLNHMPGIVKLRLRTRAEGLTELQKQEGMGDILKYLPKNPLPTVIEIEPALNLDSPEKISVLFEQLKVLPPVEQAKLDIDWLNRLHTLLGFVSALAKGLMLILALAVILIVGNTLRLAIHHRHEEMQVLKLVGATDSFILRPFLYSGLWYGILGAIFAVLLVNIFILSMAFAFKPLAEAYHLDYSLLSLSVRQAYLIVFVAGILGWLGARIAVKSQLASIEPYS